MDLTTWLGTAKTSSPKAHRNVDNPKLKRRTLYKSMHGVKACLTPRAHLRKEELEERRKSSRQLQLASHRKVDPGKGSRDDPAPVTAGVLARRRRLEEYRKAKGVDNVAADVDKPKPFVVGKVDVDSRSKFDFAAHKKRVSSVFVFNANRRSNLPPGRSQWPDPQETRAPLTRVKLGFTEHKTTGSVFTAPGTRQAHVKHNSAVTEQPIKPVQPRKSALPSRPTTRPITQPRKPVLPPAPSKPITQPRKPVLPAAPPNKPVTQLANKPGLATRKPHESSKTITAEGSRKQSDDIKPAKKPASNPQRPVLGHSTTIHPKKIETASKDRMTSSARPAVLPARKPVTATAQPKISKLVISGKPKQTSDPFAVSKPAKNPPKPEKPAIVGKGKGRPSNLVTDWKDARKDIQSKPQQDLSEKEQPGKPKVTELVLSAIQENEAQKCVETTAKLLEKCDQSLTKEKEEVIGLSENSETSLAKASEPKMPVIGWGKTPETSPKMTHVSPKNVPKLAVIGWGKTPDTSPKMRDQDGQNLPVIGWGKTPETSPKIGQDCRDVSTADDPVLELLSQSRQRLLDKTDNSGDKTVVFSDSCSPEDKRPVIGWGRTTITSPKPVNDEPASLDKMDLTCQLAANCPQTPKSTPVLSREDSQSSDGSGMQFTRVRKVTQEMQCPGWTQEVSEIQLVPKATNETDRTAEPSDLASVVSIPQIKVTSYEDDCNAASCQDTGRITKSNIKRRLKQLKSLPDNVKKRESLLVRTLTGETSEEEFYTPNNSTRGRSKLATPADEEEEEDKENKPAASRVVDGGAVTKTNVRKQLKTLKPLPANCKHRESLAVRGKFGDTSEEEFHSAEEEETGKAVSELAEAFRDVVSTAESKQTTSTQKKKARDKQVVLLASAGKGSPAGSPRRSTRLSAISRSYKE